MPAPAAKAPSLYKPKSKIRLRLGLTPPHPQPMPTQPKAQPAQPQVTKEPQSAAQSAASTVSLHVSTTSSTTSHTDNTIGPRGSLYASTNTVSTSLSRGDSRDAFALDTSPSATSGQSHTATGLTFDTISYATASPISDVFPARSTTTLVSQSEEPNAYPTPSPSSSPSRGDYSHLAAPIQSEDPTIALSHPGVSGVTVGADDIFSLTDQQLSDRFTFISEIGFGNWGSVWLCKPKHHRSSALGQYGHSATVRLGRAAAASGGSGAGGKVAVKLVHRSKSATTAARVRALWGEMKIIRGLRHEPHPSVIQFEAFVITPSYALVIMPHLSHLIPVCLPPYRATPYFRQLCSAVGYLHERGITHNDIKPANVLLSHNDVPVLVDFGFAQKWDVRARGSFLSSISWGTPEYLDPQRAKGMPHDERASDVWSLGVTMFEILIGRTPFEATEDEQLATPEDLIIYYERSRSGEWIGDWSMPHDLQHLLRSMICPDPAYRMSAMQAYHHPSLQLAAPSVIITPHFVRAAAEFDYDEPVQAHGTVDGGKNDGEKKKRRTKRKDAAATNKENRPPSRASTPTALGESIKQHTNVSIAKPAESQKSGGRKGKGKVEDKTPSPQKKSKSNIVKREEGMLVQPARGKEERGSTPTKVVKPAQPLRIKELSIMADKPVMPRASASALNEVSRPVSAVSYTVSSITAKPASDGYRNSNLSFASNSTVPPKNHQEAVLKTMRSLEGARRVERLKSKDRDVLGAIKRPAPSPPRPRSLDSQLETDSRKAKEDQRRSLGVEKRLMDVQEESPGKIKVEAITEVAAPRARRSAFRPASRPQGTSPARIFPHVASPPRLRLATRPTEVVADGRPFPPGVTSSDDDADNPLAELREGIFSVDRESATRLRYMSGDLIAPAKSSTPASRMVKTSMPASAKEITATVGHIQIPRTRGVEALGLEIRLDKFALWVKDVERIVEDARKALAEGREPPLPALNLPTSIALPSSPDTAETPEHQIGVTPDKASTVPAHLRTCSTQVEPATPPKWMTEQDAKDRIKRANEWMERNEQQQVVGKKAVKKERPSVSHVLKLFSTEKSDKVPSRTNTPELLTTVPLKGANTGRTLRGAPSTPALRSSTTRASSKPLTRKSESNLRSFNAMPTFSALLHGETSPSSSPRRAMYEGRLEPSPGVVGQGDGWSSWSSARGLAKPSSMISLRERAMAFLRDDTHRDSVGTANKERHIVDLAQEVERENARRNSRGDMAIPKRPGTPAGNPNNARVPDVKGKGIFGRLKGLVGRKGVNRVDEA